MCARACRCADVHDYYPCTTNTYKYVEQNVRGRRQRAHTHAPQTMERPRRHGPAACMCTHLPSLSPPPFPPHLHDDCFHPWTHCQRSWGACCSRGCRRCALPHLTRGEPAVQARWRQEGQEGRQGADSQAGECVLLGTQMYPPPIPFPRNAPTDTHPPASCPLSSMALVVLGSTNACLARFATPPPPPGTSMVPSAAGAAAAAGVGKRGGGCFCSALAAESSLRGSSHVLALSDTFIQARIHTSKHARAWVVMRRSVQLHRSAEGSLNAAKCWPSCTLPRSPSHAVRTLQHCRRWLHVSGLKCLQITED
jgi:hypothetical protein